MEKTIQFDLSEKTLPEVPISEQIQTEMFPEPIQQHQVLDLERTKQLFAQYTENIKKMVDEIEILTVDSRETNKTASFLGTVAAKILKEIKAAKEKWRNEPRIKEILDLINDVDNFLKPFIDDLSKVKKIAGEKTARWTVFEEQERQKAEMAARQAARELEEKLKKEAEETNRKAAEEAMAKGQDPSTLKKIEPPLVVEPIIPQKETTTRTDAGSSSVARQWNFEIPDLKFIQTTIADLSARWNNVCKSMPLIKDIQPDLDVVSDRIRELDAMGQLLLIDLTLRNNAKTWTIPIGSAIRSAINSGIREIVPGIKISLEAKARFRT